MYPTREAALKLPRLTERCDHQEMRRYSERLLADITVIQSDPELQKALLRRHINLAEKFRDRLLQDMCARKLTELKQNQKN